MSERIKQLEDRTRFEPSEVEPRIVERWLLRSLPSRSRRRGERELLDRDPTAERHRLAAHGSRAQRLGAGHADPLQPDERQAHQVDPRHRPRRDRDPSAGREGVAGGGHQAASSWDARRSCDACGSGARITAARSSSSSSDSAPPVTTPRSASRSTRATPVRSSGVRGPIREGLDLPRPLHRQLGSGQSLGDLRPRGRGAPGDTTRSTRFAMTWRAAAASRSPPSAPRRCWGTPRWQFIPTTSATATSSGARQSCRWSAAICRSSPTTT